MAFFDITFYSLFLSNLDSLLLLFFKMSKKEKKKACEYYLPKTARCAFFYGTEKRWGTMI